MVVMTHKTNKHKRLQSLCVGTTTTITKLVGKLAKKQRKKQDPKEQKQRIDGRHV